MGAFSARTSWYCEILTMDANLREILVGIDGAGDEYCLAGHVTKPIRRASLSVDEIEELLRFNHPTRERHRRYVLIDEFTGHVWGDVVAADPIKACRAVDARCGQHKREYTDIGSVPFDGHSGYHVYLATSAYGDYAGADGQDGEFIKAVEAMPFVTRVVIEKL
jgi:hypothetical protein